MTDERKSGWALIAGTVAGIIIMSLHPSGHDIAAPGQLESVLRLSIAVHALALFSLPVLFLGAWGLSRRVETEDRVALAGLVTYAFGLAAVMNAGVLNGLVAPGILRQVFASDSPASQSARLMAGYYFRQNQAFAQVYVVAVSVAIALWSVSIIRSRRLDRALAIYGVILAPIILIALLSGHLSMGVHGFGMVVLCQGIWFIAAGVGLCRAQLSPERTGR
jgi:hypothetical protein